MRHSFDFSIGRWAVGVIVSEKVPLAGYIDGIEYMKAVENRLIYFMIGPLGFKLWVGPEPQETPL